MKIVVLNQNMGYWDQVTKEKVVRWILKGDKIQILSEHPTEIIRSSTVVIKMPMVVRLLKLAKFKPKKLAAKFTPEAVYERDDNYCQYWHYNMYGKRFKYQCDVNERTIDHVIPQSRDGHNTFENCVCACQKCNVKVKKNKTPEEAGLKLVRQPFVPEIDMYEFVVMKKMAYNPQEEAHKWYYRNILGVAFDHT